MGLSKSKWNVSSNSMIPMITHRCSSLWANFLAKAGFKHDSMVHICPLPPPAHAPSKGYSKFLCRNPGVIECNT